jgi:serine/threonine-protein kinase
MGPTGPVRTGQPAAATPVPAGGAPAASAAAAATSYLPPTVDPLLGATVAGRYQVIRKLGEGGMGAVYLATHNLLEKQVALKVLHGELGRKPDLVERFMQEAKSASRIRHENVIDISDFGITPEGLVFFAMELLNGHDLHEEIARARLAGQLLPWARSKRIFLQICSALAAAHRHGIVHRDLKPENVYLVDFLGDADFVKLLDFGIAKLTDLGEGERKLTRTGMLFGTPEYMSPEQARGEPNVDHRVDVYAMGCILFQLVTGRVPFEAESFMGVLSLHLTEPPPLIPYEVFDRIGAPRELAGVIAHALAKDRAQRYQTIEDLANAVRVVCGEAPISTGAGAAGPAPRPASVAAPAETLQRITPAPITGQGAALGPRVRTQWTGSLAVPVAEVTEARRRPRWPLAVGALALAAGAAAAAVLARRSGDAPAVGATAGSDGAALPGGAMVAPAPVPAAAAPPARPNPTPAPAPASPPGGATAAGPDEGEAPLPARVELTLDSRPRGAAIKDLATGAHLGRTPLTLGVTPGRAPRQYQLSLAGYADAWIEVIPSRATLSYVRPLVRRGGAASPPGVRPLRPAPPGRPAPALPPGGGEPATPPPGSARPPGPPAAPAPIADDCPALPCLKADPTRPPAGSGS